MKDEFDDVTPDMFDRQPEKVKKVSKPDMTARDAAKAMTNDVISKASGRVGGGGAGGETGFGIQKMNKNLNRPYKKGGTVSSASKRADGCVTKGRTKGRFV